MIRAPITTIPDYSYRSFIPGLLAISVLMISACSDTDMAADSLAAVPDTNGGVAVPVNGFDEAEPAVVDNSGDVLNSVETTQPVDDQGRAVTGQDVNAGISDAPVLVDAPDVELIDPDEIEGTNIPGDDSGAGNIASEGPADTLDEPVNDFADNVPAPVDLSIARALLESRDYQTLLTLIQQVDLKEALDGDNNGKGWTLFAFPDTAYQNENFMTVTDEQTEALVRRHIFPGRLEFSDIDPGLLGMTHGLVDVVKNNDGTLTIGGATVVAGDRVFSNGTIHFVDGVLDEF